MPSFYSLPCCYYQLFDANSIHWYEVATATVFLSYEEAKHAQFYIPEAEIKHFSRWGIKNKVKTSK